MRVKKKIWYAVATVAVAIASPASAQSLDQLETQYAMTCGPSNPSPYKQMCPMVRAQIDQLRADRDARSTEEQRASNSINDDRTRQNLDAMEQSRQQFNDTMAAQAAARAARQNNSYSSSSNQSQSSVGSRGRCPYNEAEACSRWYNGK